MYQQFPPWSDGMATPYPTPDPDKVLHASFGGSTHGQPVPSFQQPYPSEYFDRKPQTFNGVACQLPAQFSEYSAPDFSSGPSSDLDRSFHPDFETSTNLPHVSHFQQHGYPTYIKKESYTFTDFASQTSIPSFVSPSLDISPDFNRSFHTSLGDSKYQPPVQHSQSIHQAGDNRAHQQSHVLGHFQQNFSQTTLTPPHAHFVGHVPAVNHASFRNQAPAPTSQGLHPDYNDRAGQKGYSHEPSSRGPLWQPGNFFPSGPSHAPVASQLPVTTTQVVHPGWHDQARQESYTDEPKSQMSGPNTTGSLHVSPQARQSCSGRRNKARVQRKPLDKRQRTYRRGQADLFSALEAQNVLCGMNEKCADQQKEINMKPSLFKVPSRINYTKCSNLDYSICSLRLLRFILIRLDLEKGGRVVDTKWDEFLPEEEYKRALRIKARMSCYEGEK